jgi:glutamate--cysteine ligase
LLQIENEFYGTIRPKRVIFPGERPLHALRERGVEYVEVRLMDLDPFEPVGINAQTLRFLDVFLLHCLLSDSPADSPDEIAALARNQHRVAECGREPGLQLDRAGATFALTDWARELLQAMAPIALKLDASHGGSLYADAVTAAGKSVAAPDTLPSARVLRAITEEHGGSFTKFVREQSLRTRKLMLESPLEPGALALFEEQSRSSRDAQHAIEASDSMPFDIYLQEYLSAKRLMPVKPLGK